MTKRLEILKNSLAKKEQVFDEKLQAHIADVKSANGQPLNDKRNGHVTLNRWEKQNDSLRNQQASIEKTKRAIEHEQGKILDCEAVKEVLPQPILDLLNTGELTQWRKNPRFFFVLGVEKARIVYDPEKGLVYHRYLGEVTDKEQRRQFARVYNKLNAKINNKAV